MPRRYPCLKTLVCLIFLVAGCSRSGAPSPTPTSAPALETAGLTTYVVQRGRVARTLEFTGRIAPIEEVPLYFKTGGYVKQVFVQPGDQVQAGDLLALRSAGAYGFVMSSNYNSRPRAVELMVDGDRVHVIRRRETLDQLLEGETLIDE